jgi:hypothetical protein
VCSSTPENFSPRDCIGMFSLRLLIILAYAAAFSTSFLLFPRFLTRLPFLLFSSKPTEGEKLKMETVLFVESGFGCDQHGQNATKAAMRACRNAIEFNSIPSTSTIIPGKIVA